MSQECNPESEECGEKRLAKLFSPVLPRLGEKTLEYFEHNKQTYIKSDGTQVNNKVFEYYDTVSIFQGTKMELVKVSSTFKKVVDKLSEKVFSTSKKESFLMHCLKKLLSSDARAGLRKNLGGQEAICYSDFSKGNALRTF